MNRAEGFKAQHVENKEVKIKKIGEKVKHDIHLYLRTLKTILTDVLIKTLKIIITTFCLFLQYIYTYIYAIGLIHIAQILKFKLLSNPKQ